MSKYNDSITIHCSNCGATMEFKAGTGSLQCAACGTVNQLQQRRFTGKASDLELFLKDEEALAEKQETDIVKCKRCGAELVFDESVFSDNCDFCGSHLVASDVRKHRKMPPQAVLPFEITQAKAMQNIRRWIKKQKMLPGIVLKQSRNTGELVGMYLPFWAFQFDTEIFFKGKSVDYEDKEESYYENGRFKKKSTEEAHHYKYNRTYKRKDNYVSVPASSSFPKEILDNFRGKDLVSLTPFSEKYLSGFRAESYNKVPHECVDDAQLAMTRMVRQSVKRQMTGEYKTIKKLEIEFLAIRFRYVLLPVWLLPVDYRGKRYHIAVNGKSGRVEGNVPYDRIKLFIIIVLSALFTILTTYWYFAAAAE